MREFITNSIQSLLAGVLIGFGDIIYVVSENHILGAFLFSLGLISILIKGYPLYTGRIGYIESFYDIWKEMIPMLIFNFIGIGIICWAVTYTHLDLSAVDAIVAKKFFQPMISTLILSFGCGTMMYLAVNGWRNHVKPILVIMPIMFFILCGFEHCIANFGYFCMWLAQGNDIPTEFYDNILLMILGNAFGSLAFSKI